MTNKEKFKKYFSVENKEILNNFIDFCIKDIDVNNALNYIEKFEDRQFITSMSYNQNSQFGIKIEFSMRFLN